MSEPKLYLLDVEGTVAPVSFVAEVLFPYARAHFEEFLRGAGDEIGRMAPGQSHDGTVFADLVMLLGENRAETDPDAPQILLHQAAQQAEVSMSPEYAVPRILEYVNWLMDRDRKSTALKSMQGKIWKAGYERGELTSEIFDDVPDAFARWSRQGKVAIYSSGSIEAQKLFFEFSDRGDLTPLLSGYFDTRTGPKREGESYRAIAREMGLEPGEVLFFSDVVAELDAAREAGCQTRLVIRPGNAPIEEGHGHQSAESFAGL